MSALLVGYARCSTDQQDLTAQRDALLALGVRAERIYVDHGLTGTNRERPGRGAPWPPAAPATPSWSPSSTASPGPCPTPGRSPTSSPQGRSASRWVARSTTPPTPSLSRSATTRCSARTAVVRG